MTEKNTAPQTSQPTSWRYRLTQVRTATSKAAPFASGVLAALVALLLYNAIVPAPKPLTTDEVNDTVANAMASATPAPAYSALVYQSVQPSLVLIETQLAGVEGEEGSGLGTGVIIDNAADILTSLHVVDGASEIMVTFADGSQSPAIIVAAQPEKDIAVLQPFIPPDPVIPAVVGNPDALRVGDEAYVVGNPYGLYGSMSTGVISGFDRYFEPTNGKPTLEGLIQIDAAVNPGNSGGPLLNRYGQVVGIVVGLTNPTEQDVFIGIGFAVPIDVAGAAAGLPPY
jgi:S1-C subfamily serine protease